MILKFFQISIKIYIGAPFTDCRKKKAGDITVYNEQSCIMFLLYAELCEKCSCYLPTFRKISK